MTLREQVLGALQLVGCGGLPEEVVDGLVLHAGMLLAANTSQNLTRITDERDVAMLHVADSLVALPHLAEAPAGRFADIGSGGGYPGIPLAMASCRPVVLVESRGKRAAFLEEVVLAVGLDGSVAASRAEELPTDEVSRFAAVTARALAPLVSLVELAAPLLMMHGRLIALKGDPSPEEIAAGDQAARIVGLRLVHADRLVLPGVEARRAILCYERVREPSVVLPRRPGSAQRKPLA